MNTRKILALAIISIFGIANNAYAQGNCHGEKTIPIVTFNQCNSDPWVLVFEDNFEENQLDTFRWVIRPWAEGSLAYETQQEYNSFENAVVSDGTLKIVAKNETVQRKAISWKSPTEIIQDGYQNLRTYNYTSSNLWTRVMFDHGAFEARVKIPKGKGFWPAFWTYGDNPWNELDVFEFMNTNNIWGNYDADLSARRHNMNVHYDYNHDGIDDGCHSHYTKIIGPDFSEDFHIFTTTWEKDKIQFFVDGNLKRTDFRYYTTLGQGTGCTINAGYLYILNRIFPQDPMHMILNLAIYRGSGAPDGSTTLPNQMEVDWVRYYRRTPCNTNVNITNASQYPLSSTVYNAIPGENISINCNYNVNQLEVIGENSIIIGPGFTTENNAYFVARINPNICHLGAGMILNEQDENISSLPIDGHAILHAADSVSLGVGVDDFVEDIRIYPNPNSGSFILEFGDYDYNKYLVTVVNSEGKIVFSESKIISNNHLIDLDGQPAGGYILYIIDKNKESIITHRIIIQ